MPNTINLYSDTQTKPTLAMRRAIVEARVSEFATIDHEGDDPKG